MKINHIVLSNEFHNHKIILSVSWQNTLDVDEEGFIVVDGTYYAIAQNKKGRKTIFGAWEYLRIVEENGLTRAVCKHCNENLATSVNSGTSHLLKHAKKKVCPRRYLNLAHGQTTL